MNLPVPTAQEVQEFAALYHRKFGVVLGEKEAWEAATITLQLFYLGTYTKSERSVALRPPVEVGMFVDELRLSDET